MDPGDIAAVLGAIDSITTIGHDTEVSMEVNPGTLGGEYSKGAGGDRVAALMKAGVNRMSIGLQSADEGELKALGRIHSLDDFMRTYDLLQSCGVPEISVDIMTAIPHQTEDSLQRTLETVTSLKPGHISAYSLIIEEGTPFGRAGEESLCLPDEDTSFALDRYTVRYLKDAGYDRYEISNYALMTPAGDHRCRHNLGYWERADYLGIGVSAASLVGDHRFTNAPDVDSYIKDPGAEHAEDRRISRKEAMEEFMFLGLRKTAGVSEEAFEEDFGVSMSSVYDGVIKRYAEEGLMKRSEGRVCLTERGLEVSNIILSDFLL